MNPKLDALLMQATCGIFADEVFEGTGTLISDNGHVVVSSSILKPYSADENFEIRFSDGKPLHARIEKKYSRGIAVLKIADTVTGRRPLQVKFRPILTGRALMYGYVPEKPDEPLQIDGRIVKVRKSYHIETDKFLPYHWRSGAPIFSEDLEAIIGIESPARVSENVQRHIKQILTFHEEEMAKLLTNTRIQVPGVDFNKSGKISGQPEPTGEGSFAAYWYPAGEFYTVEKDDAAGGAPEREILFPAGTWLSEPSNGSSHLEFRFRLDEKKTGIPFKGATPEMTKPEDVEYPVEFGVEVWSDDFQFISATGLVRTARKQIILTGPGPSSVARFPVKLPEKYEQKTRGVIFVFLRHDELIGGFRVEAQLTEEGVENEQAQTLEHIYLSHRWFGFKGAKLEAPVVTLYFRSEGGDIRLFVFSKNQQLWARAGSGAQQFADMSRDIYLELEKLAVTLTSETFVPASNDAYGICLKGYEIFSKLFYTQSGAEKPVAAEFGTFLSKLPTGSWVTIATDRTTREFLIPWGMIYDKDLPPEYPGRPELTGFWGARFKLNIQQSAHGAAVPPARPSGASRFARLYQNHVQAGELVKLLGQLESQGKIQKPAELTVKDNWLPDLLKEEFDFIHFFCHGYTRLDDAKLGTELQQLTNNNKLMYSPAASDVSHIETDYGKVLLSVLQVKLQSMRGSPIVQLSMCESAQVSCSGDSFVSFFLNLGARAVVGTEGPVPFKLARAMDERIITDLMNGQTLRDSVWNARKELIERNYLALIYIIYGDSLAKLV